MVITPQEQKTRQAILTKLEHHLPLVPQAKYHRIMRNRGHARLRPQDIFPSAPEHDVTYVLNHAAVDAISHCIESYASEIAEGEMLATFQTMDHFSPRKALYKTLSQTLNSVRVWGEGIPPKGCPKIDFVPTFHHELNRYWTICFSSEKGSAVLICKQVNQEKEDESKLYMGFYSANPYLVQSIRRSFLLVSCGLDAVVRMWQKEQHVPRLAPKELERFFTSDENVFTESKAEKTGHPRLRQKRTLKTNRS